MVSTRTKSPDDAATKLLAIETALSDATAFWGDGAVIQWSRGDQGSRGSNRLVAWPTSPLEALEHQRGVGAAEAEGVGDHHVEFALARALAHVVEVALGVGVGEVDGGGHHPVAQGEHADARL